MDKQIKALEAERARELKERQERFEKDIQASTTKEGEEKRRLAKLRGKPEGKATPENLKEWSLVNVEALKDFIKYGSNKVLDQIRTRSHSQILAREAIEKANQKKPPLDTGKVILGVAMLAIVGAVVYVTINNFMNTNTITADLTAEKIKVGDVSGKLAACQSELAQYKPSIPGAPNTIIAGQGGGNTIEG